MIKVSTVEDHTLFREGIKGLLSHADGIKLTGEYANGKAFIDDLPNNVPDIVLMDIDMPVMNGIEASRELNSRKLNTKIIVLTMHCDKFHYYEMISVGVAGFVVKDASSCELVKAIQDVNQGLGFFSPKLLQETVLSIALNQPSPQKVIFDQFTKREIELIQCLCQGLTTQEISDKLCLSPKTVEGYKTKLLSKADVRNTAGLIIYAIKNKIVEL